MTMNVNNRPEVEAQLVAAAGTEATGSRALTGPEKAEAFEAWAKSFPPNLPILTLESISRESIYQQD